MAHYDPSHDKLHVYRVRNMALKLAESVNADKQLVEMTALFHDMLDHKYNAWAISFSISWDASSTSDIFLFFWLKREKTTRELLPSSVNFWFFFFPPHLEHGSAHHK